MSVLSIQWSGGSLVFQMGKLRLKDILWLSLDCTEAGDPLGAHAVFIALCCMNPTGFSRQRDDVVLVVNVDSSHFVGSTFQSSHLSCSCSSVLLYMAPAAWTLALQVSSIHEEMDTLKSACNHVGLPTFQRPRKGENKFPLLPGPHLHSSCYNVSSSTSSKFVMNYDLSD